MHAFHLIAFAWLGALHAVAASPAHANPRANVDWESFGFGLNDVRTDKMWLDRVTVEVGKENEGASAYSSSEDECLVPLGNLELSPTATVLNYGQALFEGLKACRREDGSIAIFRPEKNGERMAKGAARFFLPPIPSDVFVGAVDSVVRANAQWVPPHGKGALYLRPLLIGSGEGLGVKPSTESTFCIYCSPVGNYFKGGLKAIRLQAVRGFSRAAPGGAGSIKASGNYAPAFLVQRQVRQRGFDEVLCLDALTGQAVEEAGASNFFAVFPDGTIVTPSLQEETILPGVTRASIFELAAAECGLKPVQRRLALEELRSAKEAFCCGTGACITPVGSVHIADCGGEPSDQEIVFGDGESPGPMTEKLYHMLTGIQTGSNKELAEKYSHWIHVVEP